MNTVEDLRRFMHWKNVGLGNKIYVDGTKVDIDTLDELPDVVILTKDCRSYTFVRTSDEGFVSHYYIYCSVSHNFTSYIDIVIATQDSDGFVTQPISLYPIIGNVIHKQYGDTFPTNLNVLYRLIKVADKTINDIVNKNKLISLFYGVPTKNANH